MSTKKMVVTPHQEASVSVQADRFESIGDAQRGVVLFVGQEIVALFPHIESIVIEQPPESPKRAVTELAQGEAFAVDLPPTVTIGTVNVTVSADATAPAVLSDLISQVRGLNRSTGHRGECLDAVVACVGELVAFPATFPPEGELEVLRKLKNTIAALHQVAINRQRTGA